MAIGEQSDEAIVSLVRNGDREAFAELVERHKRGIARFISAGVKSPTDVSDLTQETFLRAYAHIATFNPQLGKFSTWLYQIARNVVRTHLTKTQRRPQTQALPDDRSIEERLPDLSRDVDPESGILRAEAESEVRAALAELPERTRTVLALRYFDNLEYQAIASAMGLSLGNVKTLIHRGKIALAKRLQDRDHANARTMKAPGGSHALLLV